MKDWILDRWDARPRHLGRWVVGILAIPLLIGGGWLGHASGSDPNATETVVSKSVSTEKIKGKVITVKGVKKIKLPPKVVTRNGHSVTLPGSTVAFPVSGPTTISTTTVNGTTFVTVTKTVNVPTTITGPSVTVTTTVITTVIGPGNTITLTSTVTSPPPPPVTSTVTDTQTVTCTVLSTGGPCL